MVTVTKASPNYAPIGKAPFGAKGREHTGRGTYSPAFLKQLKRWNAKLAAKGFVDIEDYGQDSCIPDGFVQGNSSTRLRHYDPATEEYYRLAEQWTQNVSRARRKIWQLHAEGKSLRQIAKRLDLPHTTVNYSVTAERERMLKSAKVIK